MTRIPAYEKPPVDTLSIKGDAPVKKKKRRRFTWDDFELTLLSLPTVAWFIAFCYIPLFGIVFAFKNYKVKRGKGFIYSLFVNSKWVGLKNFNYIFSLPNTPEFISLDSDRPGPLGASTTNSIHNS